MREWPRLLGVAPRRDSLLGVVSDQQMPRPLSDIDQGGRGSWTERGGLALPYKGTRLPRLLAPSAHLIKVSVLHADERYVGFLPSHPGMVAPPTEFRSQLRRVHKRRLR